MDEVALLLELFDELAELFGEAVHGALEAGQQVERHDDGEADAGDCGQQVLFHAGHLLVRGRLPEAWQSGAIEPWGKAAAAGDRKPGCRQLGELDQASSSTSTLRMLAPL